MSSCSACGAQIDAISGYSCNYCTGSYCADHRLPEQHFCPGVDNAITLGPEMRSNPPRSSSVNSPVSTRSSDVTNEELGWFWLCFGLFLYPLFLVWDFMMWSIQSWTRLLIGSSVLGLLFSLVVVLVESV